MKNTIFSISTSFSKSAIAIVRVSGPSALKSLELITKKTKESFPHKQMNLCNLYNKEELLDKALVVYFKENHSYTGEHLIEYHVHGSLAVLKELIALLGEIEDHRLAEQGEFTKKALLNSKLTLVQAESILDLINSETKYQRNQALQGISNNSNSKYLELFEKLKEILSYIEASIDFSDEEIPDNLFQMCKTKVLDIKSEIDNQLSIGKNISKIKNGISISILGSPNVGKSSLLNVLTNEETAIVSSIAGTTRDVIEAFLDIEGYPVKLYDTAGIRETEDIIEKEGIKRAIKKQKGSDISLFMLDSAYLLETFNNIKEFLLANNENNNSFLLINKVDKSLNEETVNKLIQENNIKTPIYFVSLKDKTGIENFKKDLTKSLENLTMVKENPIVLQKRHYDLLESCSINLEQYIKSEDLIIQSFYIREALNEIGKIIGKFDIEDVLGKIFSEFCIGK